MDEAKKLFVLEQENEELKRELRELFKTLDQMNKMEKKRLIYTRWSR